MRQVVHFSLACWGSEEAKAEMEHKLRLFFSVSQPTDDKVATSYYTRSTKHATGCMHLFRPRTFHSFKYHQISDLVEPKHSCALTAGLHANTLAPSVCNLSYRLTSLGAALVAPIVKDLLDGWNRRMVALTLRRPLYNFTHWRLAAQQL